MTVTNVPVRVSLSARGLASIQFRDDANDFEFIVGESGSRHRCPWFIADFLSPRIAALHAVDNMICSYRVETDDERGEFANFISLGRGDAVSIDLTTREFYELLGEELQALSSLGSLE
jgi:hypothetical protein